MHKGGCNWKSPKNVGIDFYSGFKKNPGIDFYSGFRENAQGGGAILIPKKWAPRNLKSWIRHWVMKGNYYDIITHHFSSPLMILNVIITCPRRSYHKPFINKIQMLQLMF